MEYVSSLTECGKYLSPLYLQYIKPVTCKFVGLDVFAPEIAYHCFNFLETFKGR